MLLEKLGEANNYEGLSIPLGSLLWLRKTFQYEESVME